MTKCAIEEERDTENPRWVTITLTVWFNSADLAARLDAWRGMRAIVDDHTEPLRNGDDGPCIRYIDSRFFTSFGFGMPDPGGLPRACHDLRETGGGQRGRNKGGRAPGAEARSASWRPPPAASRPMPRRGPRRPAPAGPSSPRRRAPRPAFPARGGRTCQNPSTCNAPKLDPEQYAPGHLADAMPQLFDA